MLMTERTRKKTGQTTRPPRRKAASTPDVAIQQLQTEIDLKVVQLTESNRQLKRKIFDLYTIFEISRNFNAVLKFQTLLDSFIFTCLGQVGASKGAIFLQRDASSEKLHLVKAKGSGEFPSETTGINPESKLLAYLAGVNRPVPTGDLISDICTSDELEILGDFQSGLAVPLIYQTRLIGLLLLADKISGRKFTMDDIEFLSILANQIAVAIENARLYEGEKMAATQLRNLQQQLVQTERLAALGEMSAKIAHEVNNPLGIIKNYLLLIRRTAEEKPEAIKHVGIVEQEIDRIAGIVRQLLDFHRPKPPVFSRVNLKSLVTDVLELMERPLSSNNIHVETKFPPDLPEVLGARDNLKQVLLNLVINARDAMPEGGRLEICAGTENGMVRITVCDTGPGIAPEIQSRIFDPFFTTKEPGQGTGLGLSVCYGIVKYHNGSISFRNTEHGGCFEIHLPLIRKGLERDPVD
jgi:signal transduction histidine kinase